MSRIYTGVGARAAPTEILSLMTPLGKVLCDMGYRLRSGGAVGSDTEFEKGARLSERFSEIGADIFLSWNGMSGRYPDLDKGVYDATQLPGYDSAIQIAASIHPIFYELGRGPRAHHTRNVYEVLGSSLSEPSNFLIYYAVPIGNNQVKGGTNTAVQLAMRHSVPAFNLHDPDVRNRLIVFLRKQGCSL